MTDLVHSIVYADSVETVSTIISNFHRKNIKKGGVPEYQSILRELDFYRSSFSLAVNAGGAEYFEEDGVFYPSIRLYENVCYAIKLFTEPPKYERRPIIIAEMPDYLTDEELSEYFGWELSTIASKRSRKELPQVNGLGLTPKTDLIKLLEARTTTFNEIDKKKEAIDKKIASYKK